jgi:hypothetical protein
MKPCHWKGHSTSFNPKSMALNMKPHISFKEHFLHVLLEYDLDIFYVVSDANLIK